MEIFKEGVKMKADVHTLSLLLEIIPNIFCSIPFFRMIKLHPNYAFVWCVYYLLIVKIGTTSSFPSVIGYISNRLNYHNKKLKN